MTGVTRLMTQLLYGGGLRLNECLQLRVKDIDFDYRQLVIRDAKGARDRFTILPATVIDPLKEHLTWVKRQHQEDLARGNGAVYLPFALAAKYPNDLYACLESRRACHPQSFGLARFTQHG
jgi:integrase